MGSQYDLEAMRAQELARLVTLRKLCAEVANDAQSDEKQRRRARRLISRIDAMQRRWGATDATQ